MAGKPNIPDSIKLARGTLRLGRVNRKQPKNEGTPKKPFERGSIADTKWREIVAGLKRCGIIDKLDGCMIEAFCRNWQRALEAEAMLTADGLLIELADGRKAKHPAATIAADCWSKVRALGNDLGLNHLSRQRLIATPASDEPPKRMRRNRYGVEKLMTDDEHLEERYLS